MVEKHTAIVHRYVRSRWFLKRDMQDFIQVGMLGLIRGVKGWREDSGYTIERYCLYKVRGAITNHMDMGRMIQPPRGYRRKSEAELDKIMDVVHVDSITEMLNSRGAPFDPPSKDERASRDIKSDVVDAINRLEPIQAAVIKACCIEGRDMKSFGREHSIPNSTVRDHRERGFKALRSTLHHYASAES